MKHSQVHTVQTPSGPAQVRRFDLMRLAMGAQLARMTDHLARNVHRTERDRPIDLDSNPQWRQVYADPSPDKRIIASSQVGKTLFMTVVMFAGAELDLEMCMVFPKDDKRNEFVNDKVQRTIENTAHYAQRIKDREGTDSTKIKHYNKGKIMFLGANSETELISSTGDAMLIDERDFCNRNNLAKYPSRLNSSDFRLTMEVSTPTLPGEPPRKGRRAQPVSADNIHTQWLKGDQRLWTVACPHCGLRQCIQWDKNFISLHTDESGRAVSFDVMDQDWSEDSRQDLRACCAGPECRRPFDRCAPGLWVPQAPGAKIRSYWINRLCSPLGDPMADFVMKFGEALGNPSKLQNFHNMDLGVPFAGGHIGFTEDLIRRCAARGAEGYSMLQRSDGPCTAGIDVNQPFFDVQISRWYPEDKNCPQVKVHAAKVQGREALYALLKAFNVKVAVIDQQPELTIAEEIQRDAPRLAGCRIIRGRYSTHPIQQSMIVSEGDAGELPRLVTLDRTATLDALYQSFLNVRCGWFNNFAQVLEGVMLGEMMRPVRSIIRGEDGAERFAWVGAPDHQLHAANLDLAAGILGKMVMHTHKEVLVIRQDLTHQPHSPGPRRALVRTPESVLLRLGRSLKLRSPR